MTSERPPTAAEPDAFLTAVSRCNMCSLALAAWPHLRFCHVHEPVLQAWLDREFRTEPLPGHGPTASAGEGAG